MSLTEILAKPEVAAHFSKHIRLPTLIDREQNSPPIAPILNHQSYALVGTAFDYCFRFCMAVINPSTYVEQPWIAELALDILKEETHTLTSGLSLTKAEKGLLRTRELYQEFQHTRVFTRRLARASLFLAALDAAYRRGPSTVETKYLNDSLESETEDCMQLVRAIPREKLIASNRIVLNPSFGAASRLVGGADADLILDDTLIEVKTTKYFKLTPQMVHQLIGYRILLSMCKDAESIAYGSKVDKISIYFSRHGVLTTFNVNDLISEKEFESLKDWLVNYASDYYSNDFDELLHNICGNHCSII